MQDTKACERLLQRRIKRTPIYDQGTFQALLHAACEAGRCLRHAGRYWVPLVRGRQVSVYRLADYSLEWLQERVEQYEFSLYLCLATAHCGRDGALRRRSRLRRSPSGVYRSLELPTSLEPDAC